ncbi:MAG TPA: MnhB domain-containing protein [Synergistaceae bacterium]|nr:MnhB domain-containing protein [Synergistaceae bacterium]HPJ25366.1 MnhB domain-containing protein [Synergistaceae bacterium]HPQ36055.1 MnhB domain-containing protein [Synergistaceae bacterium]
MLHMRPLSVIARVVCNAFAWFMVVFGSYVIIHGHLTPGGGFQGGAVVATALAFLVITHGGDFALPKIKKGLFISLEQAGLLLFICTGFVALGTTFFYNFLAKQGGLFGSLVPLGANPGVLNSSGTIALMNMAVGFEVVGGLSLILFYMLHGIRQNLGTEEFGKEETGHDR